MTNIDDQLITQNICKPGFVSVRLPHGITQDYRPPTDRSTYNDAADLNSPHIALLRQRVELETSLFRPPTGSRLRFNPTPEGHTHELITSIALLDDINVISDVNINKRMREDETIEADPLEEGEPPLIMSKVQLHFKIQIMAFKQLVINCYRLSEPGSVFKVSGHKCAILTATRKFLGNLYHEGNRILSLDNYKKALPLAPNPPATSQELHSFASCVRYALNFIPNLSAMMAKIDSYITQHPVGKIRWDDHPDLHEAFKVTARACRELCCLDSLPSYPSHTEYLVLSADSNDTSFGGILASKAKSEGRLRLHQLLSCRLPEAVQNLHIYLKEMYSLVALINQVEDVLKLFKGVKIKAVVDNSALFISLSKLAKNGQLTAHAKIIERDKINVYLSRLYQAITTYGIEIYLVGTKSHLADYASRSPIDWEKEIMLTSTSWETQWTLKQGPPCAKCSLHEMQDLPHPEYCDKKLKHIPSSLQPSLLQVIPSPPRTIMCEGKPVTYRAGGVKVENPRKIDFTEIFHAIYPLPLAREEHLLAKQPLYPSDSEQLVFLIKNLTPEYLSRAEEFFNKTSYSTHKVACVYPTLKFITIHPRVTLFWGSHPLGPPPYRNTMIALFLPTEAPRPKELKGWPKELKEAKALTRPRFSRRISEPTPLIANVNMIIACYGARSVEPHYAPIELFVSLMRQIVSASVQRKFRRIVVDGELIRNAFNLGRKQVMTMLSALWNELEYLGLAGVKCEVYFNQSQEGDSTNKDIIMRWPLFIQGKNTAEKIGEVSAIIYPRGVEWKELCREIQRNIKWDLQTNYEIYVERRRQSSPLHYTRPEYVYLLTIDLIKVTPRNNPNLRCANLTSILPPEVSAEQDRANLSITQHCDPFINKIIQGALEKKIGAGKTWTVKGTEFKIVNHVLMGREISQRKEDEFKPVLPTMRLLPELIKAHYKVDHRGYRFCMESLSERFYFKQGITTPQDIVGLCRMITKACTLCLHRTLNQEPKLYYQTRKVALSLHLPNCCTLSHDVMYLQGPREYIQPPGLKYVSLMVCNTCNYLSAKPLTTNSSDEIARHLLEVIQESGRIPSLLLSDSGAAESLGNVEKTITSLRNLILIRNCKILSRPDLSLAPRKESENIEQGSTRAHDKTGQPSSTGGLPKKQDNPSPATTDDWGPPSHLSAEQIEELMDKQSCLYRQPFNSGPPARKGSIPSSLGLVDIHCRLLGQYLRKEWSPNISKAKLVNKILSYNIFHNHFHVYSKTGFRPAELHLSRSQYLGRTSLFHIISGNDTNLSPQLEEIQEVLAEAHKLNQAQKKLMEESAKDLARNEKKHGTLSSDSEFLEKYPRLGLVLVQTHRKAKLTQMPIYIGPALILARQVLDRNLFLLDLTTGHILKRSYRQVKPYISSDFLNLPEDIRNTLQAVIPLGIITQGDEIPSLGSGLSTGEWTVDKKKPELTTVLANILQVFRLIKPSLPDFGPHEPFELNLDEEEEEVEDPPLPREVSFDLSTSSNTQPHTTTPPGQDLPPARPKRTVLKPLRYRD